MKAPAVFVTPSSCNISIIRAGGWTVAVPGTGHPGRPLDDRVADRLHEPRPGGADLRALLRAPPPRHPHLTEAAAEPEPLGQTEADEVAQSEGVEALLELLALEHGDVAVEPTDGLEQKALTVFAVEDDSVGDGEQRMQRHKRLVVNNNRVSICLRDFYHE